VNVYMQLARGCAASLAAAGTQRRHIVLIWLILTSNNSQSLIMRRTANAGG